MIKVGVVGSRRRNTEEDKEVIKQILLHAKKNYQIHLVSGGCPKGADKFAEELAEELNLSISIHYPDEKSLPDNPKYYDYVKMYFERNSLIAEECDILLALPASDRKGGTEDTIKKCESLNKKVILA